MARVLGVPRQGYYTWLYTNNKTASRQAIVDVLVFTEFQESKGRNGYRRVHSGLLEKGYKYGHNTIQNFMKLQQLQGRMKRRFVKTTDSNHNMPVNPNILKRDFSADLPNKKWVGDVNYIWTVWLGLPGKAPRFVYL